MTANLCDQCQRPLFGAAAAAYLCPPCTEHTAERLAELPGLYVKLEEMLLPAAQCEYRSSRAIHSPVIVPMKVADARAAMARALGSWHRALFDALEWEPPPLIEDQGERVRAAVKALVVNVPWIAGSWPAAGDFAREIRDVHRDASSIVGTDDRGRRLGLCPTQVDGSLCGAPLRLPPGGTVVECKWCGSSYPSGMWPALRMAQETVFSPVVKAS